MPFIMESIHLLVSEIILNLYNMIKRSSQYIGLIFLLSTSFICFSQDDGLQIVEDVDDIQIKFENHYFEALKYKAIGNYSRAVTELETCQQLIPNDVAVDFEFSKNYLQLGKFNEAALYVEKALRKDSLNIWYLKHAKGIYVKQYRYPEAIAAQQKIITLDPRDKPELVLLYVISGDRDSAQMLLDELKASGIWNSRLENYQKTIANYTKRNSNAVNADKHIPKSLNDLKKDFTDTKSFNSLKALMQLYFENGEFESLLDLSNEGLELYPAQPIVYLLNGTALNEIKKYNNAINVLMTGLDFIIEDIPLEIKFYKELKVAYVASNDGANVEKCDKRIKELEKQQTN